MANCLKNYIGIKGGIKSPRSGIYINQLPGFTLDKINKISESENQNLDELWGEIENRSWLRLEKDIRTQLRVRYKLKTVQNTAITKQDIDPVSTVAAAAKYRGIVIDLGKPSTNFLCFIIKSISINVASIANNADLVIKVFDENGTTLFSGTKSTTDTGNISIGINRKIIAQKIFVAIDTTDIQLQSGTLTKDATDTCCKCICLVCPDCTPSVTGAQSDIATPEDVTETDEAYSMQVTYSVTCDYSSIVCNNKPEFADVWLYLLGAETMLEVLFSTKMNRYTTIDRDRAAELRDYYTEEYQKSLEETIKAIEVKEEDCCIECNPTIARRESLP